MKDGRPFTFAGLWENWKDPESGEWLRTCSIITIPTGELPHGIWSSGDGTHIYVALENGTGINVIDTLTNKVEARISGGQSSQALVYVPNAVSSGDGLAHLNRWQIQGCLRILSWDRQALIPGSAHYRHAQ
jgi:YVTN family beta-propeller protein